MNKIGFSVKDNYLFKESSLNIYNITILEYLKYYKI